MARILIGWEFGANRGHALCLAGLGERLRAEGHEPIFALQRIDALSPQEAGGAAVWQAPVTPRLLTTGAPVRRGPPVGMADILARLGIDDPGIVAAMIRAWRGLFEAARADLVIAEFAPFLQLAARGRLPAIAIGTGFSLPPAALDRLPRLVQGAEGADQAVLLEAVNAGLAATGTSPIAALPQLFGAERVFAATFAELDPYAPDRPEVPARPLGPDFKAEAGSGEEVFVYAPERIGSESPLWAGLAASGLTVRVHVPRIPAATLERLTRFGFLVEPEPLPIALIAERSRLLVSHGGHGIVCAGLVAGLPHVVCHYDLEKVLHGAALARLRLGGHAALAGIEPKAFGASLAALHGDESLAARAKAAAQGFRARDQAPLDDLVAMAAGTLAPAG